MSRSEDVPVAKSYEIRYFGSHVLRKDTSNFERLFSSLAHLRTNVTKFCCASFGDLRRLRSRKRKNCGKMAFHAHSRAAINIAKMLSLETNNVDCTLSISVLVENTAKTKVTVNRKVSQDVVHRR